MNPETEPQERNAAETELDSTLQCSADYHISQFTGRGAARAFSLYDRCMALSRGKLKTGKAYLNHQRTMAPYLHCHRNVLVAAAGLLVNAGWLIVESRKPGAPTTYHPVSHDDWVLTHPGLCVETYAPNYWEKDSLGAAFYGLTGGIKIGGPNVLKGWRKLIPNDDLIKIHIEKYVRDNPKPRYNHEYTTWIKGFGNYLREQSL